MKIVPLEKPLKNRSSLNPILEFEAPFDMVVIDILGPLPMTDAGNKYVLVLSNYLSKWPEAFALKDTKAETIAEVLINEVICRRSAPRRLLSDQGTNFLSEVVAAVCGSVKLNTFRTIRTFFLSFFRFFYISLYFFKKFLLIQGDTINVSYFRL